MEGDSSVQHSTGEARVLFILLPKLLSGNHFDNQLGCSARIFFEISLSPHAVSSNVLRLKLADDAYYYKRDLRHPIVL